VLPRRPAGRLLVLALVTASVGLAVLASPRAGAAVSPIQPANQPTPIPGATNGMLPAGDLVNVSPGCQADRAAGPSLGLLLAEARERNVVLGTEQCYRSLQDQASEQQIWTGLGNSACAAPVVTSPGGQLQGTSMHGWGKAVDFFDSGGTVAFGSPGYAFLKAYAGQVGWNHPDWAEPGGSACPEAWHWEWVGDGGIMGATPIRADVVGLLASGDGRGYATVSGLGGLVGRGDFVDRGSAASTNITWLMVGAAATRASGGYWLVAADGGVFSFGDARFYGSTGGIRLNEPVVGMAATPDGGGYWLVAADGGVFSFGDARFYGSTGGIRLNEPVVGIAATPDGGGYWLVGADGGVFNFGGARFYGSTGSKPPPLPIVSMVATGTGAGYWLASADGSVLAFGDANELGAA
jgi:hypothetical protein